MCRRPRETTSRSRARAGPTCSTTRSARAISWISTRPVTTSSAGLRARPSFSVTWRCPAAAKLTRRAAGSRARSRAFDRAARGDPDRRQSVAPRERSARQPGARERLAPERPERGRRDAGNLLAEAVEHRVEAPDQVAAFVPEQLQRLVVEVLLLARAGLGQHLVVEALESR